MAIRDQAIDAAMTEQSGQGTRIRARVRAVLQAALAPVAVPQGITVTVHDAERAEFMIEDISFRAFRDPATDAVALKVLGGDGAWYRVRSLADIGQALQRTPPP
jgi:hypothetical protein